MRSLDSLRSAGEIPGRVGLLKIDAEGADAEVLRGASSIDADLVMVEFWGNLPETLGPCPFELEELRSLVEPLGPRRFLFVQHGPRHLGIREVGHRGSRQGGVGQPRLRRRLARRGG